MVYTYFESQKLSHPMRLVPNRTPWALGKTLAGKKMPAGTRLGTAAITDTSLKTISNAYLYYNFYIKFFYMDPNKAGNFFSERTGSKRVIFYKVH
jgi:hypothetical protein